MVVMSPTSSYLPSGKFIGIIAILCVLGGVAYFITSTQEYDAVPSTADNILLTEDEIEFSTADIDGDGLSAWEEALWGTNPRATDSDGDGTGDGIEIAAHRNPLVAVENDTMETYPIVPSEEGLGTGESTRTNSVSRAFMSYLYQAGQSGEPTMEDVSVLTSLIANEVNHSALSETYTKDNITIGTDDSDNALHAYINTLATHLNAYLELGAPYEAEILTTAIKYERLSDLSGLDRFTSFFESVATNLESTVVPPSLADAHLKALNGTHGLINSLTLTMSMENDPILGLTGISMYRTALGTLNEGVVLVRALTEERALTFTPSEEAYRIFGGTE
jgi:hypothetical protein